MQGLLYFSYEIGKELATVERKVGRGWGEAAVAVREIDRKGKEVL